ncbi:MAG: hypothetical protein K1060chlam4_00862, partial [Candidatus Anoxychlamydiales bacterium]|nr:hypothetical protein [Candidatus Anoxychlamydiales bacterium]
MDAIHYTITAFFIIGYLAIIFEFYIKVNKTASALLMAVFTWVCLFFEKDSFQDLFRNEVQSH